MVSETEHRVASPEDLHKVGMKLFLESTEGIDFGDFLRVFNLWIQKQPIAGHMLIDVHDYRHVKEGPGLLLVGHEGNFALDFAEGRAGLLYTRKQALDGDLVRRLRTVLSCLLTGCLELEQEPILGKSLKFSANELRFFANDRLNAPNTRESFEELKPSLVNAFGAVSEGPGSVTFHRQDKRERLTLRVDLSGGDSLETLASRLEAMVD